MVQKDIENILNLREKGFSLTEISKELDINRSNIAYVCRQKNIEKLHNIIIERENEKINFVKLVCEAIPKCYTYSHVCKALGLKTNRQYIDKIKKIVEENNLDVSHFKPFYHVRFKKGEVKNEDIFVLNGTFDSVKVKNRLFSEGLKEKKCERCGITDWCGEPISLQLHHINGCHTDNRIENLQILCPNCHSQTENFCRKKNFIIRNKRVTEKEFDIEQILLLYKNFGSLEKVAKKLGTESKTIKKYFLKNGIIKSGKDIRRLVIEKYGKQPQWNDYRNTDKISKYSIERSIPIEQYDKNGNLINCYNSIRETENFGFNSKSVCKCINGQLKTHKGFIWKKKN